MVDTQTPERIWTTYNDALGCTVTIHEQPKTGSYAAFVKADLHAAVVAERDQLKAKLTELEKHRG